MACLLKSGLEPIDLIDGLGLGDHDRVGSEAHHCAILTVQISVYLMGITSRDPRPTGKIGESCQPWPWDMS